MSSEAAGSEPGGAKSLSQHNDEAEFFMATTKQGTGPGGTGGGLPCPRKCGNSFSDPQVLAGHVSGQHYTAPTPSPVTDGRGR